MIQAAMNSVIMTTSMRVETQGIIMQEPERKNQEVMFIIRGIIENQVPENTLGLLVEIILRVMFKLRVEVTLEPIVKPIISWTNLVRTKGLVTFHPKRAATVQAQQILV